MTLGGSAATIRRGQSSFRKISCSYPNAGIGSINHALGGAWAQAKTAPCKRSKDSVGELYREDGRNIFAIELWKDECRRAHYSILETMGVSEFEDNVIPGPWNVRRI